MTLKKPGVLPGFLFFLLCLCVGISLSRQRGPAGIYEKLCLFVDQHIYLADREIKPWLQSCVLRSHQIPRNATATMIIEDLNQQFSSLKTSHLEMFSSEDSQKIWQGESAETGIDADYVEGELVIFQVQKNSAAEYAGLRMGDVIYRIDGEPGTPATAEKKSGSYFILRNKKITEYKIQAQQLKREEQPQLVKLSDHTVVLKVPSFRAEFFEKTTWQNQVQELKKYPKIIIDLRGNRGGNFVAGLRFLSAFMCSPQDIGYIWKPKSRLKTEVVLPDDLDDEKQIDILNQTFLMKLWTFEDYDCVASSIAVLVDSATASTAEMAAQALRDYVGAKVFGSASSGQLLVGVWYPVPELGPGVQISVPEAVILSRCRTAKTAGTKARCSFFSSTLSVSV
jgi:carboxyl-terminal processing protease